jgi:hypothetical protein
MGVYGCVWVCARLPSPFLCLLGAKMRKVGHFRESRKNTRFPDFLGCSGILPKGGDGGGLGMECEQKVSQAVGKAYE